MSCQYKDGNYCGACASFLGGDIPALESSTGYSCPDNYSYCPIAAAVIEKYNEYEDWHEKWKKGEVDEKGKPIVRNDRAASVSSSYSDSYDIDEGESYSGSGSYSGRGSLSSFYDFYSAFTDGGFLAGFLKAAGLIILLLLAGGGAYSYADKLNIANESFIKFLEFASVAGVVALFVLMFRLIGWTALAVPIVFVVVWGITLISPGSGIGKALSLISLIITVIAGAVPGGLTCLVWLIFLDKVDFKGAGLLVFFAVLFLFGAGFGIAASKLVSKR